MGRKEVPLHSSRRGRGLYRLLAAINLAGMMAVLCYRVTNIPHGSLSLRLLWAAMTLSELWFVLYWIVNQAARWDPIYRSTFKDRLSLRFEEELPGVDAFVCTADPWKEPPLLVIGTVLSLMAYDYPPEKLSVYLSDDGGSDLTLYALLEASAFYRHWLPFGRKFKIEPRSPAAFFSTTPVPPLTCTQEWSTMKSLYEDMANRIQSAVSLGRVPPEIREEHQKLFSDWNSTTNSRDHPAILKILSGGGDSKAADVDNDGWPFPTLVYLAREKRPACAHHFKAGAMNALVSNQINPSSILVMCAYTGLSCQIPNGSWCTKMLLHVHVDATQPHLIILVGLRVSSEISNAPIILNVDCDMYSNDSQSVRDTLCFFMDEETRRQVAFVQFPQKFNVTKNDIYDASLLSYSEISTLWSMPFVYVIIGTYGYSLVEVLCLGGTWKMWWNGQRMWMFRRLTSYLFAFVDSMSKLVGMGEMKFTITSKVVDADATTRYENEIMEFGLASPMFILLTTVAVHNLVCWVAIVVKVVVQGIEVLDALFFQATLCGLIGLLSLPIYEAAFVRRDKGRVPTSVAFISVIISLTISFLVVR